MTKKEADAVVAAIISAPLTVEQPAPLPEDYQRIAAWLREHDEAAALLAELEPLVDVLEADLDEAVSQSTLSDAAKLGPVLEKQLMVLLIPRKIEQERNKRDAAIARLENTLPRPQREIEIAFDKLRRGASHLQGQERFQLLQQKGVKPIFFEKERLDAYTRLVGSDIAGELDAFTGKIGLLTRMKDTAGRARACLEVAPSLFARLAATEKACAGNIPTDAQITAHTRS